jgi:hypothetical protein
MTSLRYSAMNWAPCAGAKLVCEGSHVPDARRRGFRLRSCVFVGDDVPLIVAAKPLSDLNVDLLVVRWADGGWPASSQKTDVVRQICRGSNNTTAASDVMIRRVISVQGNTIPFAHVLFRQFARLRVQSGLHLINGAKCG